MTSDSSDDPRYHYVVVGAGSSGATLAARLTEQPDVRVLLLESGPDFRSAETPPEMRSSNTFALHFAPLFARYRWPQLAARQAAGREVERYTRGRGAGGSSSVNAQLAIRGMPQDYDEWAELGATGWSGADVLPYFVRLEDDADFGDREYHGTGGPLPVARVPPERWGPLSVALRDAALSLDYGWNDDHNAPHGNGVSPFGLNLRDGQRVSVNDGYLEHARDRENLTVIGDAHVDRVVFQGTRATGVRVRIDGEWRIVEAGEVVLSAGAIHSPAILARSGVGRPEEIGDIGAELVRPLPVGQNLLDHAAVAVEVSLNRQSRHRGVDEAPITCIVRFSSGLCDAGPNDMAMMALSLGGNDEAGLGVGSISVSVYRSFSRGEVRTASADPDVDPQIDFNLLSDERDLVRMRDGARRLLRICRQPAVARVADAIALAGSEPELTVAQLPEQLDDETLDDWLLRGVSEAGHAAGTCRMGDPADPRTVVDADCRVLGLQGLRVVDASIMPEIPRANPHLTCVMIGELMADRIKRTR